jgi:hypothetical protein
MNIKISEIRNFIFANELKGVLKPKLVELVKAKQDFRVFEFLKSSFLTIFDIVEFLVVFFVAFVHSHLFCDYFLSNLAARLNETKPFYYVQIIVVNSWLFTVVNCKCCHKINFRRCYFLYFTVFPILV